MPNNIAGAVPSGVLPAMLYAGFSAELRFEAYINAYQDGSSDRLALALNPRRFFRCTGKFNAAQYTTFWTFFKAHLVQPFWFYYGPEAVPPFSSDPSGNAPSGRYAVVFDGGWSESIGIARSQVNFGMREVA